MVFWYPQMGPSNKKTLHSLGTQSWHRSTISPTDPWALFLLLTKGHVLLPLMLRHTTSTGVFLPCNDLEEYFTSTGVFTTFYSIDAGVRSFFLLPVNTDLGAFCRSIDFWSCGFFFFFKLLLQPQSVWQGIGPLFKMFGGLCSRWFKNSFSPTCNLVDPLQEYMDSKIPIVSWLLVHILSPLRCR